MKKLWFKRKRYGWGWTPATWEGWVVLAMYGLVLVYILKGIERNQEFGSEALMIILASVILIGICYLKGEKPKWSWGDDKNTN